MYFYQGAVFEGVASDLGGRLLNSFVWLLASLVVLAFIIGLFFYIRYRRKFDIRVIVRSERAGEKNKKIFDKAAIIVDRNTGTKFFRIWDLKKDLPIPPYSVLQTTDKGDLLELLRRGEDEFVFLNEGSINKEFIIRADGKLYPFAQVEQKQVEGDVWFWNIKKKADTKKLFDTEHILMKLLPYTPHLIGGVITIFILYLLFDSLPTILGNLTQLTQELRSLKGATSVPAGFSQVLWNLI